MQQQTLPRDLIDAGMTWERYLERVSRSRHMQIKRYQNVAHELLADFSPLRSRLSAVILSGPKCGDGAWAIPRLHRVLQQVGVEDVRFFFRDEYPELMNLLLTNGKRAVPKLAIYNEEREVVAEWGPYPSGIVPFVNEHAGRHDRSEWYPRVMEYYREEGVPDLFADLQKLLSPL